MTTPRQLKKKYSEGKNISALLRLELGEDRNTREIIEISYDMQSGSYIEVMQDAKIAKHKSKYSAEIANLISSLGESVSVLEAGVGEATTLSGVLSKLPNTIHGYGFDLSWSRVAYANRWLSDQGIINATLCSGDLLNIPFLDNSIDVVYTSHSIEPNGGNEEPILKELLRITNNYLILLEPGYELASQEARDRMDSHGYCKNLPEIVKRLGYKVERHELFLHAVNPLNPTAVTVISKQENSKSPRSVFACPKYKTPIQEVDGAFYSPEALVAYPILGGVPCLRVENGIFASHYLDVFSTDQT